MLPVLLVFFALGGGVSSAGQSGGVAGGLQVLKQLVSGGELSVTGRTVEVHFLLEVDGRRSISNPEG